MAPIWQKKIVLFYYYVERFNNFISNDGEKERERKLARGLRLKENRK